MGARETRLLTLTDNIQCSRYFCPESKFQSKTYTPKNSILTAFWTHFTLINKTTFLRVRTHIIKSHIWMAIICRSSPKSSQFSNDNDLPQSKVPQNISFKVKIPKKFFKNVPSDSNNMETSGQPLKVTSLEEAEVNC